MSRIDNLEFLSDVVPKTMAFKQAKAIIENEATTAAQASAAAKDRTDSTTVNGHAAGAGADGDEMDVDANPDASTSGQQQVELQLRSPRANGVSAVGENGSSGR